MRPENNLQLEAGYIYADCTSSNKSPLAVERRTIHYHSLSPHRMHWPFGGSLEQVCETSPFGNAEQDEASHQLGACIIAQPLPADQRPPESRNARTRPNFGAQFMKHEFGTILQAAGPDKLHLCECLFQNGKLAYPTSEITIPPSVPQIRGDWSTRAAPLYETDSMLTNEISPRQAIFPHV